MSTYHPSLDLPLPPSPSSDTWIPVGWQVDDPEDPWTIAECVGAYEECVKAGKIDANGKVAESVIERHVAEVTRIAENVKLLRTCWATDAGVWRLVETLAGRPIQTDPFYNPWSRLAYARTLTGTDGTYDAEGYARLVPERDGFDSALWRGFAGVNGPYDQTKRWVRACADYGKTDLCAAVVPYRGDKWLWDFVMPADLLLHFGRTHFHAPEERKDWSSSPAGCTIVGLWIPEQYRSRAHPIARRAIKGRTCRIPTLMHSGKSDATYIRHVLVTPGCSSKVEDVFGLLGGAS